jgi:hypothetical protein
MRRRVVSAAATIRANEAVSAAWAPTATTPHSRPSTLIAAPTTARIANLRTTSVTGP